MSSNTSFPTITSLRLQATSHNLSYAAWPGEAVDFSATDRTEAEDDLSPATGRVAPLLIDVQTASRIVSVYDAMTCEDRRAKIARMVSKSRSNFLKIAQLAWSY